MVGNYAVYALIHKNLVGTEAVYSELFKQTGKRIDYRRIQKILYLSFWRNRDAGKRNT